MAEPLSTKIGQERCSWARSRLANTGSRHQLAESLSRLSLSGLQWEEASCEIYQTVKQKAKYWVYDHREEVNQIVLERKAAGNTAEARVVAKRKFAMLRDAWWDRRANQLQCAADTANIKMVHQLLREVCGQRPSACQCLGEMEQLKLQKTQWKPSGYISRPSLIKTEMLTGNL